MFVVVIYKPTDFFCDLILYLATFLKILIISSFLVDFILGSLMYNIPPANSDNLTYFPICIPLVSYSCLIALASTSSTMLRRNGDSGQPCLIPDFDGDGVGLGSSCI